MLDRDQETVRNAVTEMFIDAVVERHPALAGEDAREGLRDMADSLIRAGRAGARLAASHELLAKLSPVLQSDIDSLDGGLRQEVVDQFHENPATTLKTVLMSSYAMVLDIIEKVGLGIDVTVEEKCSCGQHVGPAGVVDPPAPTPAGGLQ